MSVPSVRRLKQRSNVEPTFVSPEERANRAEKARKIADVVHEHVAAQRVTDPADVRRALRMLSDEARRAAADAAGQRMPSEHTWAIVVALVVGRVERARQLGGDWQERGA